jgi:hypothetical protein
MAMRETVRSLRAYFIVVALLSGVMNLTALLRTEPSLWMLIPLVGVGFAVAYFYLGLRLRQLLATSPGTITGVLIAGAIFLGALVLLDVLSGMKGGPLFQAAIGLLVTWYLFSNVKRLAAESSAPASVPSANTARA